MGWRAVSAPVEAREQPGSAPPVRLCNHARLRNSCRRLGFFLITKMNVEMVLILMQYFNNIPLK